MQALWPFQITFFVYMPTRIPYSCLASAILVTAAMRLPSNSLEITLTSLSPFSNSTQCTRQGASGGALPSWKKKEDGKNHLLHQHWLASVRFWQAPKTPPTKLDGR